jgi:peroxiredoxin
MEDGMLQPGDLVPHFEVTNLKGETVSYSTIWQRRNLVLIALPASDSGGTFGNYVSQVTAQGPSLTGDDTAWVITGDAVAGIPSPAVVVADRWGEIVHIARGSEAGELPPAHDVVEWVTYVQHQCPECEGEAK